MRLTLPLHGNPFTMAFESFRWDKNVSIKIVYEMRVNIVALPQRAFYSKEITTKTGGCCDTLPSRPCCISLTTQLCTSVGAGNQERDSQIFYLCAQFLMSRKGEALLYPRSLMEGKKKLHWTDQLLEMLHQLILKHFHHICFKNNYEGRDVWHSGWNAAWDACISCCAIWAGLQLSVMGRGYQAMFQVATHIGDLYWVPGFQF